MRRRCGRSCWETNAWCSAASDVNNCPTHSTGRRPTDFPPLSTDWTTSLTTALPTTLYHLTINSQSWHRPGARLLQSLIQLHPGAINPGMESGEHSSGRIQELCPGQSPSRKCVLYFSTLKIASGGKFFCYFCASFLGFSWYEKVPSNPSNPFRRGLRHVS